MAQFVPTMMNVDNKSSAESTREAMSEMDDEYHTATTLAPTRRKLTRVLTVVSLVRPPQLTVDRQLDQATPLRLSFSDDERRSLRHASLDQTTLDQTGLASVVDPRSIIPQRAQ